MAEEEDVDIIGVSFMSGGQVDVTAELARLLGARHSEALPIVYPRAP